jgi:hypothetical protein
MTRSKSSYNHRYNQMHDVGEKHRCRVKDTGCLPWWKTSFKTHFGFGERPQFFNQFSPIFQIETHELLPSTLEKSNRKFEKKPTDRKGGGV